MQANRPDGNFSSAPLDLTAITTCEPHGESSGPPDGQEGQTEGSALATEFWIPACMRTTENGAAGIQTGWLVDRGEYAKLLSSAAPSADNAFRQGSSVG